MLRLFAKQHEHARTTAWQSFMQEKLSSATATNIRSNAWQPIAEKLRSWCPNPWKAAQHLRYSPNCLGIHQIAQTSLQETKQNLDTKSRDIRTREGQPKGPGRHCRWLVTCPRLVPFPFGLFVYLQAACLMVPDSLAGILGDSCRNPACRYYEKYDKEYKTKASIGVCGPVRFACAIAAASPGPRFPSTKGRSISKKHGKRWRMLSSTSAPLAFEVVLLPVPEESHGGRGLAFKAAGDGDTPRSQHSAFPRRHANPVTSSLAKPRFLDLKSHFMLASFAGRSPLWGASPAQQCLDPCEGVSRV